MSEDKLYAVKNDEGEWLSFDHESVWYTNNPTFFKDKSYAEAQRMGRKAHVVELVESPAKVVLTKEQAEIVERVHDMEYPAYYISVISGKDEELLMSAYVNGYTVEKEKKYNLILGTDTDDGTNALFKLNYNPCTDDTLGLNTDTYADDLKLYKLYQFTQAEIDKYNKDFWIKNIDLNDYKVEVEE